MLSIAIIIPFVTILLNPEGLMDIPFISNLINIDSFELNQKTISDDHKIFLNIYKTRMLYGPQRFQISNRHLRAAIWRSVQARPRKFLIGNGNKSIKKAFTSLFIFKC